MTTATEFKQHGADLIKKLRAEHPNGFTDEEWEKQRHLLRQHQPTKKQYNIMEKIYADWWAQNRHRFPREHPYKIRQEIQQQFVAFLAAGTGSPTTHHQHHQNILDRFGRPVVQLWQGRCYPIYMEPLTEHVSYGYRLRSSL